MSPNQKKKNIRKTQERKTFQALKPPQSSTYHIPSIRRSALVLTLIKRATDREKANQGIMSAPRRSTTLLTPCPLTPFETRQSSHGKTKHTKTKGHSQTPSFHRRFELARVRSTPDTHQSTKKSISPLTIMVCDDQKRPGTITRAPHPSPFARSLGHQAVRRRS